MIKIAIIDDHELYLEGLKTILSNQNNLKILFVSTNVKDALQLLTTQKPDLIITDISMPNINGIEFVKILKKQYPEIKILVISMFNNINSLHSVNGYLLKETNLDEVIIAINKIVIEDKTYFVNSLDKEKEQDYDTIIIGKREKEIIRLIAEEYTSEQIADKLFISTSTVLTHRKNIFTKLHVTNIAGMVKKAIVLGIINQ